MSTPKILGYPMREFNYGWHLGCFEIRRAGKSFVPMIVAGIHQQRSDLQRLCPTPEEAADAIEEWLQSNILDHIGMSESEGT